MNPDLERKTGRQIACQVFAIAPGVVLNWINQFETLSSTKFSDEVHVSLVFETSTFALYYLRRRFAACVDAQTNERIFSNAIDILANLLATVYFQPPDTTGQRKSKTKTELRELLDDRTNIYSSLKASFLDRILRRTPTVVSHFAALVNHWAFSKIGFNKKVGETYAESMVNRIFELNPQAMIEEASQALE